MMFCGFTYVDNSDLIAEGNTGDTTLNKMQQGINLWEGLIKATGGAMPPLKSWWYLVDFVWGPELCFADGLRRQGNMYTL